MFPLMEQIRKSYEIVIIYNLACIRNDNTAYMPWSLRATAEATARPHKKQILDFDTISRIAMPT